MTPDNFEPNPKNLIIASFFRNIGWSDALGSGIRNLYKYSKFYSGKEPEFTEGDIFRIIVPLDSSFFTETNRNLISGSDRSSDRNFYDHKNNSSQNELSIINYLKDNVFITNSEVRTLTKLSESAARKLLKKMTDKGIVNPIVEKRHRKYELNS